MPGLLQVAAIGSPVAGRHSAASLSGHILPRAYQAVNQMPPTLPTRIEGQRIYDIESDARRW